MNNLLNKVFDAYGGLDRWKSFKDLAVRSATGGPFRSSKGVPENRDWGDVTIRTVEEWTSIAPYWDASQRTLFTPDRVAIEDSDCRLLAELREPRTAFSGYGQYAYWDLLRRGYVNGYALWTYLATPFLFAQDGVDVEEGAP